MRRAESGFSIVDFLIILALLLIVAGMVIPHLAQSQIRAQRTAVARPARTAPPLPAR